MFNVHLLEVKWKCVTYVTIEFVIPIVPLLLPKVHICVWVVCLRIWADFSWESIPFTRLELGWIMNMFTKRRIDYTTVSHLKINKIDSKFLTHNFNFSLPFEMQWKFVIVSPPSANEFQCKKSSLIREAIHIACIQDTLEKSSIAIELNSTFVWKWFWLIVRTVLSSNTLRMAPVHLLNNHTVSLDVKYFTWIESLYIMHTKAVLHHS